MTNQDKVNFIKEWYKFKENMCKKYNNICTECPLYKSSDGWVDENGGCDIVHNCKYDFEEGLQKKLLN